MFAQLVFQTSCDTFSFVYNSLYTGRNFIAFNVQDLEKTISVMATKAVTALLLLCFLQVSYILVSERKLSHSLYYVSVISFVIMPHSPVGTNNLRPPDPEDGSDTL